MFNKYPINPVRQPFLEQPISKGYEALTELLKASLDEKTGTPTLIIVDGTHGADFQSFIRHAASAIEKQGWSLNVQSTAGYLKSGETLREEFDRNITENRAFGYVTEDEIEAYFVLDARETLATRLKEQNGRTAIIVFGPGAYWLAGERIGTVLFLDVSREYQQIQHKKQLLNFGMSWNRDSVEKYKISYFVEWPILETYRKRIFQNIDLYLDMNKPEEPVFLTISDLEGMIRSVAQNPLRVKPFFAPGIWGGQYLKDMADLPKEWVNCAWSFEPIAPENSILIGYGGDVIEVPFLIVMALEYKAIMGERPVSLFGDYFPVRFDYLDTMNGDKLSCQVHPKQDYVREHFNEFMTQQESYYIMEQKKDAKVYLGLTEGTERENFQNAVLQAQETGVPMEFTEYVNEFDSNKGDLFLIPPGTVHASGIDNLVLEVSSTTWWFTFKLYDYLRKDLDGKPRPINADHGFRNIDYDKTTSWVKQNLIPEPQLLQIQGGNEEYLLGQRDDLLFYVRRIHLQTEWLDQTDGEFVMYNLVEGNSVRIVSIADESIFVDLNYAESYILPSVFGAYKIVNLTETPCKLIKAGVSPEWNVSLIER
ncbi:class I mannose-6-phosphate isomerase [Paenibacillus sp. FSL K6-3182]|uniref:class I mannose-6-phosphate isomerase n=1 Tax=unclassified Paenibacillus TaxID=185978 RepID=UPI0030CB3ADE